MLKISGRYDIVIVGSGITGITLANLFAAQNRSVLIIEKLSHLGGNSFDYVNHAGLLVNRYGGHIFHTNDQEVWDYLSRFTTWHHYKHKVKSFVDGQYLSIPVNRTTANILLGTHYSSSQMAEWLSKNSYNYPNPQNSRQSAINRVGHLIYDRMYHNYTKKHWKIEPKLLDPSVTQRLPVYLDDNPYYFSDRFQALPNGGYTKLFSTMIDHPQINLLLNFDYFSLPKDLSYDKLFFTGPIDRFFDYRFGRLPYLSLRHRFYTFKKSHYLPCGTVNYPNDHDYTRIIEFKYMTGQVNKLTTVAYEYSYYGGPEFYPVPTHQNQILFQRYYDLTQTPEFSNIHFIGRLANYRYINMDQAVKKAIDLFNSLKHE